MIRQYDNGKNGRTVLHDQHQLDFLLQGCQTIDSVVSGPL
jgi:hypothetical protein